MTRILGPAFLVGIVLGTWLPPFPLMVLALMLVSCLGLAAVGTRPVALGALLLIAATLGHTPLPHHCDGLRRQFFGTLPCAVGYAARLGSV